MLSICYFSESAGGGSAWSPLISAQAAGFGHKSGLGGEIASRPPVGHFTISFSLRNFKSHLGLTTCALNLEQLSRDLVQQGSSRVPAVES